MNYTGNNLFFTLKRLGSGLKNLNKHTPFKNNQTESPSQSRKPESLNNQLFSGFNNHRV